jgi:hypothetical protein
MICTNIAQKYLTRLSGLARGKHSTLFFRSICDEEKKFCAVDSRGKIIFEKRGKCSKENNAIF